MRLKGKVALVTGGGNGIGRATAELFAKEGAKVAVVDIDREAGEETVKTIGAAGGQATFIAADVSRTAECERMVAETVAAFGALNVLVNNAGIALFRTTEETTEEEWDRVTATNQKSVFFGTKAAIPHLARAGGSSIIHLASVNTFQGAPSLIAYSGTKGAIYSMTIAMAKDLAHKKIRVNCICPGGVDTPLMQRFLAEQEDPEGALRAMESVHVLKRLGQPLDIAYGALYLASDESAWVTGIALPIDGGYLTNPGSGEAHE